VPEGDILSAGQAFVVPVQYSAGSQAPADALHILLVGENTFVGHVVVCPLQTSASSHTPVEAEHTVEAAKTNPLVVLQQAPDVQVAAAMLETQTATE